tara:strand:+ start:741 stop:2129 length:1389 start_codon:yes stop_codon:yes gene_type:complete
MNFVFYDTETTGLDSTFDQILQFAAILTDSDFNELGRFEMRCRIQPHIIPAPEALLATRVSPDMLTDLQLPSHYQFMREVVSTLKDWSPAIFLGYNTLNFDEPMLRQAFFQTLHPIFLTNTDGNQRCDVFRLVQATAALKPDVISVPKSRAGKPVLKLDQLAPANGFAHENAHDAMADVEATIFIANLVRTRAPKIWESLIPLAKKSKVIQRISHEKVNCLVDGFLGERAVYPVVGCSVQSINTSLMAVFDLSYEPENYLYLSVDKILEVMNGPEKAIKTIYINKMPMLLAIEHVRNLEQKFQLSIAEIQKRARCVSEAKQFHENVTCALKLRFPNEKSEKTIEKRIYERFPSKSDQKLMREFHSGDASRQLEIISLFDDDRLQEIGRRIVFLETPAALNGDLRLKLKKWVYNRKNGRDGITSGRTIKEANSAISELLKKMPKCHDEITVIQNWLESRLQDL